jgi:hypothetical protein
MKNEGRPEAPFSSSRDLYWRQADTGTPYMCAMTASPNSLHFTSFAPSIWRAKS